jgi:50S ribosomal protein L16 3-hydroxylase
MAATRSRQKTTQPAKKSAPDSPPLTLLGGMSAARFCGQIWHRKPLLIRQAMPDWNGALTNEQLFGMAAQPDVQSRLINARDGAYTLSHGPFAKLPPIRRAAWTVLVQNVDAHDVNARSLMDAFGFIERARLDDVMVSFASDGGGVGPHFDSYDVFLLQVRGQRRWRISTQKDLSLVEGLPLKILQNFKPTHEYVLDPGDMLYLPPRVAHEGIAIGPCMTYSIGFRAPSHEEVLRGFYEFMADVAEDEGRLSNAQPEPAVERAALPPASIDAVQALIEQHRPTRADIIEYLGCAWTEPKPTALFAADALAPAMIAGSQGVQLAPFTLALHSPGWFFINGTSWRVTGSDAKLLKALAEQGRLPAKAVAGASDAVQEQLQAWLDDGWLHAL